MELALVDTLFVSSWPGEVQCRDDLEEAFSTFFGSSLTFYNKSVPPLVPSAPSPLINDDDYDAQEDEPLFILPNQKIDEDDDAYERHCDEEERKHHSDQRERVEARALLDHVEIDHEAHEKVISILAKVHGKKDKNISAHDAYVCQYYHSGQQFSPLISTPADILLLVVPPASLAHTTRSVSTTRQLSGSVTGSVSVMPALSPAAKSPSLPILSSSPSATALLPSTIASTTELISVSGSDTRPSTLPSIPPPAPAQPMKRMGWAEYKARSMAGKSQQSSLSSLSNPVMGTSSSMIPVPPVISPQEVEMLAIKEQSGLPLCSNSADMMAMASGQPGLTRVLLAVGAIKPHSSNLGPGSEEGSMMDVDGPRALPMSISSNSSPAYQIESNVPAATWHAVKVCYVLQEEREESLWLKQFGMAGVKIP